MRSIKKGSTDQSVVIRIVDATDGTPETGVEHNTSGIDLKYRREGAANVDITEAALSALTDAHSDGGIEHIGNGYYRLDLPDAAFASGANGVLIHGTVTGMVVHGCYVPLVDYDPQDGVRMGMTALPNAAADAAGGLVISDAGGFDIDNRAPSATSIGNMNIVFATDFATNYDTTADGWVAGLKDLAITSAKFDTGAINANAIADGAIDAATLAADFDAEIRTILFGANVDLDVDANGRIRIVDGTGVGELDTSSGHVILADASLTSTKFATDAINANAIAADAITAAKIAADAITAAKIATGAIDADAIAADAVTKITKGLVLASGTLGATGNDTTHLHLSGLTYGDDELNGRLIVVFDVSESEYHSTWIIDWANTGDLATVETLPFTPQASTDTYWLLPIRRDMDMVLAMGQGYAFFNDAGTTVIGSRLFSTEAGAIDSNSFAAGAISADALGADAVAEIADGVWDEATSGHTTAGTFGKAVSDILVDTAEIGVAGAGLTAADDAVIAAIAALNNITAASVWAVGTRTLTALGFTLGASDLAADTITAAKVAADVSTEIRNAITGGAYALDTDANGRIRIVDGTGAGELDTSSGTVLLRAATQASIDAIEADTNELQTDWANGGRLDLLLDLAAATLTAAGVRTAVGLAAANLDTQLGDLPTAAENAAAVLDLTDGIETGLTPRKALRLMAAKAGGNVSGAGTGTEVLKGAGVATTRATATVDEDGNITWSLNL